MTADIQDKGFIQNPSTNSDKDHCAFILLKVVVTALISLTFMTGCQTASVSQVTSEDSKHLEVIVLREGDVIKISFPGTPNLDSTQQIRRDGKIALPVIGDIKAAGMTTSDLEKEILKQGASKLLSKEVTIFLQSSAFPVFITGAVIRPGKVLADHPISALEAVMEAGGFDYARANLTHVGVIRHEGDGIKNFTLNLKQVLEGKPSSPFYLKPSDIVYVPEKFSWF